jgi:hypothetical protein
MALMMGVRKCTVERYVAELKEHGALAVAHNGPRPGSYSLVEENAGAVDNYAGAVDKNEGAFDLAALRYQTDLRALLRATRIQPSDMLFFDLCAQGLRLGLAPAIVCAVWASKADELITRVEHARNPLAYMRSAMAAELGAAAALHNAMRTAHA